MAVETHAHAAHPPGHGHDGEHEHGHGVLQHQFDDLPQQKESNTLGMWLFLATEVMMFGGLFFCYTLYRSLYPYAFHIGSEHLNIKLGTGNTFVLLASSWTMAMAVHSAVVRDKKKLITFLAITWLLGFSFIVIKGFEWTADYNEGIVPSLNWTYPHGTEEAEHDIPKLAEHGTTPSQVQMYFVTYFCMTGLHAIHMIVALGLVGWFIFLAIRGQFTNQQNDQPVEILGLYWHLVDIIWIFLFPLLYLIAGFHPFGRPGGG